MNLSKSYWPGGVAAALMAFGLSSMFAGPTNNSNPEQTAAANVAAAANDGSISKADRHFLLKTNTENEKEIALAQLAIRRASDAQVREYAQMVLTDHQLMQSDLRQVAGQTNMSLVDPKTAPMMEPASSASKPGSLATYQDSKAPNASGDHSMGENTGTGSQIAAADHTNSDRELTARGSKAFTSQPDMTDRVMTEWISDQDYDKLTKESGADFDRQYIKAMVSDHQSEVTQFQKNAQSADNAEVRAFASKQLSTVQTHLDRARTLAATIK